MEKNRKIRIKKSQIDRLISDVISQPNSPIGDHLTDEEFIGYRMELLPENQMNNIDNHLNSCSECTSKMEWLIKESEVWHGKQGKKRLDLLRNTLNRTIWEHDPESKSIWRLLEVIKVNLSQLVLQVIVPDSLQSSVLHRRYAASMRLRDGSSPEIEEIEVPVKEIDGSLKITFYPSEVEGNIVIKVQPDIKGAGHTKQAIPIILRDRIKGMIEEQQTIYSGETAMFTILIGKSYNIGFQWNDKTYEVPLKF